MEFIVKKCSSSDLSFAYALDDDSYQKDEFNYETAVEEHIYTAFIKVHVGSIYIRLHSNEGSLYSITANHYTNKKDVPATNYKPGNKGVLEYVVTKDREVEVSFTPI
jgi:mRNA deadenylase 3'-5' endonuclease subunit Ccr4